MPITLLSLVVFATCVSSESAIYKQRMLKIKNSVNYKDGKFINLIPTTVSKSGTFFKTLKKFICGEEELEPITPLPVVTTDKKTIEGNKNKFSVTWIGHSTSLISLDGMLILTDPIFSNSASSLPLAPKRFHNRLPISVEGLPYIDIVLISHDHYDHLDYDTIIKINPKTGVFYTPLGVGAHLEKWGVAPEKIIEFDWWESGVHKSGIKLVAGPARHFSGRMITDKDNTQWASWIIIGKKHRVFFSGDSGYFETFSEIGKKYGPFQVTMLEMGAYNKFWPEIHMNPEEAVKAHMDLRGEILLPIHWGTFSLSTHDWREPIERLIVEAKKKGVQISTPVVGESIVYKKNVPNSKWWRSTL